MCEVYMRAEVCVFFVYRCIYDCEQFGLVSASCKDFNVTYLLLSSVITVRVQLMLIADIIYNSHFH